MILEQVARAKPDPDYDSFICAGCQEEYYLPESTDKCPICGGDLRPVDS